MIFSDVPPVRCPLLGPPEFPGTERRSWNHRKRWHRHRRRFQEESHPLRYLQIAEGYKGNGERGQNFESFSLATLLTISSKKSYSICEEHPGNIVKRRALVKPCGPEIETEIPCFSRGEMSIRKKEVFTTLYESPPDRCVPSSSPADCRNL